MTDESPDDTKRRRSLSEEVGLKAARKLKARRNTRSGVWFGLGMMGLVGWSVAVPTLVGAAIGIWLDKTHVGGRSWTLALLMLGLVIGCINAWHWVDREARTLRDNEDNGND